MSKIEFIVEIQDFPEYFISTRGRVFSEKGKKRRELKHSNDNRGYLIVSLYKEGKGHTKKVHRLLGQTFLKRVEGKNEIDHINQNKLDNRLENLRWVNHRENNINRGIQSRNKSGVNGVRFNKHRNYWVGSIYIEEYKRKEKTFKNKEEAIKWRLEMEQKYYN